MIELKLELPSHQYPIVIGQGALQQLPHYLPPDATGVCIVTNTTVTSLYAQQVHTLLNGRCSKVCMAVLQDGEQYKQWESLNTIFEVMLQNRLDRRCVVLALGGGVVGDMAGFAASVFMRGVRFIQLPTTLLAQVDSSVGGKTAINHPLGKNMIGAFHQPIAVLADTLTLNTLPDTELSAGLAEVIKHGLIADASFYEWVRDNAGLLRKRDPDALAHAIKRSCEIKADFVRQDEKELGVRAHLNFGHTFGHAIETGTGYGQWLHGHAVGTGMVAAMHLSAQLKGQLQSDVQEVTDAIAALGLPIQGPKLGEQRYVELMSNDKKNEGGRIRFIALERIGQAHIVHAMPDQVRVALNAIGGL